MVTLRKLAAETDILIVDDTPDNLRLLAKILESQGYTVRKSLSGKMALQGVHRHLPDLILLDINMPEMNGYEVCQQLKASEATSQIPIIFISALERLEDKVRAFELGGVDYITKPFQEKEVLVRIENHLLIQQQRQQLIEQNQRLEQEIQERLRAEAEVRKLSLTDELTGLYNRRGFFLLAEQQLKITRRTQTSCCLLLADVDGLKKINDFFGHERGDRAIFDTAKILRQTFRESDDIIARLGGDEFAVFIPCVNSSEEFYPQLQSQIDAFNQNSEPAYQLSISIGVYLCDRDRSCSLEELVAEADRLMYENKRRKYLEGESS